MDPLVGRRGLFAALKGLRSGKNIAASQPSMRLLLGKDDGVEYVTTKILERKNASASLVQVVQLNPSFKGLLANVAVDRLGSGIAGFAIQPQGSVLNFRSPFEFQFDLPHLIVRPL